MAKSDVEQMMEQAEAEEKARGPVEAEELDKLEPPPQADEAVKAWNENLAMDVRDPSGDGSFARSDQHPSFTVPTDGVDMSAVTAEPVEEPKATASSAKK